MCNRYGNYVSYRQYVDDLKKAKMTLVSPTPAQAPNLEMRDAIFPTDQAPVLRPCGDGLELIQLRWGLIPWFYKKGIKEWKILTTNARSESLKTTQTFKNAYQKHRCLIPVSHFFEWTGEKGHKTKWSFKRSDDEWFCFAGLWDRAETKDGKIESFALVTMAAGPDVSAYHTRQPVILERSQYREWLSSEDPQILFKSPSAGLLTAERVA